MPLNMCHSSTNPALRDNRARDLVEYSANPWIYLQMRRKDTHRISWKEVQGLPLMLTKSQ